MVTLTVRVWKNGGVDGDAKIMMAGGTRRRTTTEKGRQRKQRWRMYDGDSNDGTGTDTATAAWRATVAQEGKRNRRCGDNKDSGNSAPQ